ncbi:MAG: hypothetical protein HYT47_02975 [Candidatus Vogelbacteria bacterium]|nr:hypothetical protein [Candidatus Vogelbacteria bacterium]
MKKKRVLWGLASLVFLAVVCCVAWFELDRALTTLIAAADGSAAAH